MYVITDENMHNDGLWEIGKPRSGFAYASPELAVLVQLAYDTFDHFKIFEASGKHFKIFEASGKGNDFLHSSGEFTLLRETYVPEFSTNQRIWFAIQCALAVCDEPIFVSWAENWINGTDRSFETARDLSSKLRTAARATNDSVVWAADAAVRAAYANATILAADAAYYAAEVNPSINFTDIAIATLNFDLKEFQEIDF
jgi:hypothetical protein